MTCNARADLQSGRNEYRIFNPHITVIESQLRSFRYDFIYTPGIKGFLKIVDKSDWRKAGSLKTSEVLPFFLFGCHRRITQDLDGCGWRRCATIGVVVVHGMLSIFCYPFLLMLRR